MRQYSLPMRERRPWHLQLHELMPFRVREILLVSSSYDAFILEEDGPLTERMFTTYSELNLSWSPRITHASNSATAMRFIRQRRFDLVVAMPRIEDMNVATFGHMVKQEYPEMPVVLLSFSEAELDRLPGGIDTEVVDHCFMWTGDARILITITKLVEDRLNLAHDTSVGVPVIIVVEDSVRYATMFITELYSELMRQAQSLVAEGVNNLHKLLRMRTRPKVLHARTYEEALEAFTQLQEHVFAVISDVEFPREGGEDPQAGFRLVDEMRSIRPELPVLMQSAEAETAEGAAVRRAMWVNKQSPMLVKRLRAFVSESLGFGDFVFRLPDLREVGRARDMYEMEKVLQVVPSDSLAYHASRNHFSVWFTARGMFELADMVRPKGIADFPNLEELRAFLVETMRQGRVQYQDGLITEFTSWQMRPDSTFLRLGEGSIGGKARGIAFANSVLARHKMKARFEGLRIAVPKTVVVGAEEFDRFVSDNHIVEALGASPADEHVLRVFLDGRLSDEFRRDLRLVLDDLHGPLAVRSSSLLEDLQFQPFSGVYATYMLPNNHPDAEVRFDELCRAIKAVYASTFCENARTYIANTPFRQEDEKMGVVIQEMVGRERQGRFYPHFSGVALSHNYYPIEGQKAEEGTVLVALGLGHLIVMGGTALRFSPASPEVMPQFKNAADSLRLSQKSFYALDMTRPLVDFLAGPNASLKLFDLDAAESDGTLTPVGSVYSLADDTIRDNLRTKGPRCVTFNNILKWHSLPLAPALREILRLIGQGIGSSTEIELAVNLDDSPDGKGNATLYILQIRPLATHFLHQEIDLDEAPEEDVVCRTNRALGHGELEDIRDVVYVKRDAIDGHSTAEVAAQVGEVDRRLQEEHRPFMLIGPGRWGSSDPRLGIPIEWKQIAGARVIAETRFKDREVEPSQGTHFFQNITSLGVGYLTLASMRKNGGSDSFIDMDWLDSLPAQRETSAVRHVRLERPLRVVLNGRVGNAVIVKGTRSPDED